MVLHDEVLGMHFIILQLENLYRVCKLLSQTDYVTESKLVWSVGTEIREKRAITGGSSKAQANLVAREGSTRSHCRKE